MGKVNFCSPYFSLKNCPSYHPKKLSFRPLFSLRSLHRALRLTRAMEQIGRQVYLALNQCIYQKRFKNRPKFLPNAPKKKNGKKIARYFYRFPVFPLPARYVPVMQKTKMWGCIHEIPIGYGQDSWKQRSIHRNGILDGYYRVKQDESMNKRRGCHPPGPFRYPSQCITISYASDIPF